MSEYNEEEKTVAEQESAESCENREGEAEVTDTVCEQPEENTSAEASEEASAEEAVQENADEENADEENAVEETAAEETAAEEPAKEEATAVQPSANKKTTGILIGIICVLVAIIAIFAVLIINKARENKQQSDAAAALQQALSGTQASVSESGTAGDSSQDTQGTESTAVATPDYDITVTLGQYKGIEVDYPDITVTDEEVESELKYLIEDYTEDVEVDRAIASGDVVDLDYEGKKDGVAFDGGTGNKSNLTIGSGAFIPGFEDALIGHSKGETFDFDVTFPESYGSEELAGQEVTFTVTINKVSETVVPELTDEFIKENTSCDSLAAYKEYIIQYVSEDKISSADAQVQYEIADIAIANATFGGDIDAAIADAAESFKSYYDSMASSYYGIDAETLFLYMYGMSSEEFNSMINAEAEYSVKYQHLLVKIAEAEGLTVSEEEFEEEFASLFFDYYGYTSKEELYEVISEEDARDMINETVLRDKAESIIVDNAIINK